MLLGSLLGPYSGPCFSNSVLRGLQPARKRVSIRQVSMQADVNIAAVRRSAVFPKSSWKTQEREDEELDVAKLIYELAFFSQQLSAQAQKYDQAGPSLAFRGSGAWRCSSGAVS